MSTRLLALIPVAALVLAACGTDDEDTADDAAEATPSAEETVEDPAAEEDSASDEETPADDAAGAGDVTVDVADSAFGEILVDGEGVTLYVFANDTDGTSTCVGDCADAWPPLLGEATAGDGVAADQLGTTEREDGSVQVTYAGQPLYFFANDAAPGDTNGQGVNDVWWLVDPAGQSITDAPADDEAGSDY